MSVEGSADGSFEVEQDDTEWIEDEPAHEDSLEEIFETAISRDSSVDSFNKLQIGKSRQEIDDESTTADFVNTLIEEGLFSPPQMQSPAFEDQIDYQMPLEPEMPPFLTTPDLGDAVRATPMLAGVEPVFEGMSASGANEEVGNPPGPTHHAERAALAHALPPMGTVIPPGQPNIPTESDHRMLLNANAAQPSLPVQSTSTSIGPKSTQVGPMHDPFITLQTATSIISPPRQRAEDSIPLGRTSHADRIQAARALATQSIGLGMPRSPAISVGLTKAHGAAHDDESLRTVSGRQVSVDSKEMLFDASFEEDTPVEKEIIAGPSRLGGGDGLLAPRGLPKPPKPQQLDLPSPITSPTRSTERQEEVSEKRVRHSGGVVGIVLTMIVELYGQTSLASLYRLDITNRTFQSDDGYPSSPVLRITFRQLGRRGGDYSSSHSTFYLLTEESEKGEPASFARA